MSTEKPRNWVVITVEGRVWRHLPPESATKSESVGYFALLDAVYDEYQSAGGGWDRPTTLLLNGKVVVDRGLADLAWQYGRDLFAARTKAAEGVREKHTPAWLATK